MKTEIVNQAKQKVADKEAAFNAALETGKQPKIKEAATELSKARAELVEAQRLTPEQEIQDKKQFLDRITALRNEGKYYEAMGMAYEGVKRK